MNRKGGARRKTRQKMSKKGKTNIKSFLQSFKQGDRVQLLADPSHKGGTFPLRFYGKKAIVKSKQGKSYQITISDQNKNKSLIVHPVHLKRILGGK